MVGNVATIEAQMERMKDGTIRIKNIERLRSQANLQHGDRQGEKPAAANFELLMNPISCAEINNRKSNRR